MSNALRFRAYLELEIHIREWNFFFFFEIEGSYVVVSLGFCRHELLGAFGIRYVQIVNLAYQVKGDRAHCYNIMIHVMNGCIYTPYARL